MEIINNEYTTAKFDKEFIAFTYHYEGKHGYDDTITLITEDGIRFFDNGYSYIPYDLCALALLQEEYFNCS